MQIAPGNNLSRIKAVNQASILRMIYHFGPIKRAEIAERLKLTLPTITTNINSMIADGIVRETDIPVPAAGYPGRKAHLVDIVPEARYFVGIEMQGCWRVVCVLDFRGRAVYARRDETPCTDYDENMKLTRTMLHHALKACELSLDKVAGIGFCVPGLVNSEMGTLSVRPIFGWLNKNIRADFADLTGYTGPIIVENNACARAYGAQLFHRELLNNAETFAYLFISTGIACPLVLNTPGHYGSVVGAGEVGHMIMNPDGPRCSCGNRGCLETYSSNRAVIARCAQVMKEGGAPLLRARCPVDSPLGMDAILAAQAAGDRDVQTIVEKAVYTLGVALANVNNFACPRIVLIEGDLFRAEENQRYLLDVVLRNLCNVIHADAKFLFVEANKFSGAQGAAARAIFKSLEP